MDNLKFLPRGLVVVNRLDNETQGVAELSRKQNKDILIEEEIYNPASAKLYANVSYFTISSEVLPEWDRLFCQLRKFLVPGGSLQIYVILSKNLDEADTITNIKCQALIQGFVKGSFVSKDKRNANDQLVIHYVCNKPQWKEGAISRIGENNELTDDIGMIPDDPLANYRPRSINKEDCSTKKTACANCTCGRKEAEAGAAGASTTEAFSSKCGSCYLGDAFRCASCPYKGLPAFKPGDKVELDMNASNSKSAIPLDSSSALEAGSTKVTL